VSVRAHTGASENERRIDFDPGGALASHLGQVRLLAHDSFVRNSLGLSGNS
jgi:hypothetical protein